MLLLLLAFGPMLLGTAGYFFGRRNPGVRNVLAMLTCAAALAGCLSMWNREVSCAVEGFCGLGLHLRADGFRSLYAGIASFMWLMSCLFTPEYLHHDHRQGRYWFFNQLTLGATLGVFFSDDLYTTLIFFEIMSLTSYPWVAQEETPGAMRAAQTYLAVAVIGGLTTLMGLFLLWRELGTLAFDEMREAVRLHGLDGRITVASWLTLFGFAAKAGLFPLHIWLPKAHPVAPAPASALLSGMLTKSGVFGMVIISTRLMAGSEAFGIALLALGAATMLLGAVLALFSIDLKRTLACSSVSQIGFITVGIAVMSLLGEHGSLAATGTLEHMMNHSLIKLCLFLCAGVVFMNLHQLNLNRIRGFGRKKPLLHVCFLLGALSIGCVPPVGSGFNSKSLLHEGILEYIEVLAEHGASVLPFKALEYLFIFSGGLTVAYMTKLYICLFWEKNADAEVQAVYDGMAKTYISLPSAAALALAALPLPFLGLFGEALMSPCAARSMAFFGQHAHGPIAYFSAENLIGAAESIAVGALVYLFVVRRLLMRDGAYVNRWPAWLDMEDRLYRPLLRGLVAVSAAIVRPIEHIPDSRPVRKWIPGAVTAITRFAADVPESRLVKEWLPAAGTAVTRVFAELPERCVLAVRGTVFRPARPHSSHAHPVVHHLGRALNRLSAFLNRTLLKRHPLSADYEAVLEENRARVDAESRRVEGTVSFGLLLLAVGLLAMCLYLILR